MWRAYWSSSTIIPNIIKICPRVSKLWSTQGCVYRQAPYWLLLPPPPPPPPPPTPYYQNMSKGIEVMEHTRMRLQTGAILIAISPPPPPTPHPPKPIGREIKIAKCLKHNIWLNYVAKALSYNQNFILWGLSYPASMLYTWIKSSYC